MITRSREYSPDHLFRCVRDTIHSRYPAMSLYMALFGCSDEVNGTTDTVRAGVLGGYGGIFTTRMIGSQIFYHQIKVAISRGHRSNVFEVNVHIGEHPDNGKRTYGVLVGRDGHKRACCGALAHILEDFQKHPDEKPSISQTVDGEQVLDFLGTLKFRLKPHQAEILAADDPMLAITRINLEAQVRELIRFLRKMGADDPSPEFVYGTMSINRTESPDTETLEHFYLLDPGRKGEPVDLLR